MVVNEENTNPPAAKKFDWKIIAGLAAAVIVIAFILFRFFVFVNERSSNHFEAALGSYYDALQKNDTNAVSKLVTSDFTSEAGELKAQSGKTEVFSYRFDNLDQKQVKPAGTNDEGQPGPAVAKITYSVTSTEGNSKVSWLLEAYFVLDNGQPRIQSIKKIYKGREISR